MVYSLVKQFNHNIAHLVPLGTPAPLIPVIVLMNSKFYHPPRHSGGAACRQYGGWAPTASLTWESRPKPKRFSISRVSGWVAGFNNSGVCGGLYPGLRIHHFKLSVCSLTYRELKMVNT